MTGTQDNQIDIGNLPIGDFIESNFVTIAEDDEGLIGSANIKFGMGGKVQNIVIFESRFDRLAAKLPQTRSLLDTDSLEQQLQQVKRDKLNATGSAYSSLQRLEESLQRNLSLLNTNQDDRKAQILNLAALIQDSGGVLQRLQNHLQTANLADMNQLDRLQDLIGEMNRLQQEADLFV